MISRARLVSVLLFIFVAITPTQAFAAITDGVTPCTIKSEAKRDTDGLTYVCLLATGSSKKLVWKLAISAGETICANKGDKLVQGNTTYVCAPVSGDSTKLVWGRLLSESKPTTKAAAKPSTTGKTTIPKSTTPVMSDNQPIIIVQSTPKPIPSLIPNTSIPWPKPTGDLLKYPGIKKEQHANDQLGLSGLHGEGITGKGYSIAFIDNSIARTHPAFTDIDVICVNASDIGGSENPCPNMTIPSHGQGVAGTMGGKFGAAPGARLISIQGSMVGGLIWVAENYKRLNITAVSLSIGQWGGRDNLVCGVAAPKGFKEILIRLSNEDVAVLFSTANQATVNWVREPNCMPGVIAVASVSAENPSQIQNYSSISPDIDLLAPAEFYSTGTNGAEEMFGGTSQATPFAAALFALGKQARPEANIAQIFYYIKKTAAPVDDIYVKQIPVIRPVEMVKALKEAKELPAITLVKQIQVKSGE
jgi:subtilisin family serine protease